MAFDCTTFTLDAASKIDATAKGYHPAAKNENACGPGGGGQTSGSHGGYGATCYTSGTARYGCAYGDPKAPVWPGTGGYPSNGSLHTAGGGIVRIAASGLVTIDGTVSADAETGGGNSQRNGAGGGGRILVQTSTRGLDFGLVTNVTGGAALATS